MIIPGNALDVLKRMKTGSVHMGVTSSPYFGPRKYGTDPIIWGGDPDCAHEWITVHPPAHRSSDTNPGPLQHEGNANRENLTSEICNLCGAWKGELGLEPTPSMFVEHLTEIYHEVYRVLRDDGIFLANIGDSSARNPGKGGSGTPTGRNNRGEGYAGGQGIDFGLKEKDLIEIPSMLSASLRAPYLKCNGCGYIAHQFKWGRFPNGRWICPKCEKSHGVKIAQNGWYLRSRIPWIKRNCMPDSATDRPGKSIEYFFLLSKSGDTQFWTHPTKPGVRSKPSPDYVYKNSVTGEIVVIAPEGWETHTYMDGAKKKKLWKRRNLWEGHDYYYDYVGVMQKSSESYLNDKRPKKIIRQKVNAKSKYPDEGQYAKADPCVFRKQDEAGNNTYTGFNARYVPNDLGLRFMRDSDFFFRTWQGLLQNEDGEPVALVVNPKGFKEAHFATFPPGLIEPLIIAGSSEKGVCPKCGAPWVRITKRGEPIQQSWAPGTRERHKESSGEHGESSVSNTDTTYEVITTHWSPTCSCEGNTEETIVPANVLDPFNGAGTTGVVCQEYKRTYFGIELNPKYVEMSYQRLETEKKKMEMKK